MVQICKIVFWSVFSDQTSFLKVSKLLPVICPEESLVHSSAQIVSKHLVSASLDRAVMGQCLGILRLVLEKLVWGFSPNQLLPADLLPGQSLNLIGPREIPN